MGQTQLAPGRDDEDTAELPGIALHGRLPGAAAKRTIGIAEETRRGDPGSAPSKACGSIGHQLRIDEQRGLESELLTEVLGEARVAVADDHDLDPPFAPLLDRVAQLRDLLTAEESAEVAQEDQHHRAILPIISQPDALLGSALDQLDRCESRRSTQGRVLIGRTRTLAAPAVPMQTSV